VKRYFNIEVYKSFDKVTLYTIREEGKEHNETDEFLLRFMSKSKFKKDIESIIYYLKRIGEQGALQRYFRPEKKAVAIPIRSSKLRLYGYRVSDQILIIGNGGKKTSKKVQDSPDAFPHFKLMNNLIYVIQRKLEKRELSIEGNVFQGDLNFYLKQTE
jgi:hypothetical protein